MIIAAEAVISEMKAVQIEQLEALDAAQVANEDGFRSLSEWTTAVLDLEPDSAKRLVRTMRRTIDRPDLRTALASGEVSFDRVEALSGSLRTLGYWSRSTWLPSTVRRRNGRE